MKVTYFRWKLGTNQGKKNLFSQLSDKWNTKLDQPVLNGALIKGFWGGVYLFVSVLTSSLFLAPVLGLKNQNHIVPFSVWVQLSLHEWQFGEHIIKIELFRYPVTTMLCILLFSLLVRSCRFCQKLEPTVKTYREVVTVAWKLCSDWILSSFQ